MYRIHFEPNGGHWVVQFRGLFGLTWKTVKVPLKSEVSDKPPLAILSFASLEDAVEYVNKTGISRHYREYTSFVDAVNAQHGAGYQPVPHMWQVPAPPPASPTPPSVIRNEVQHA